MKRNIYTSSISFRCSPGLLQALEQLATLTEQHSSTIIREAVTRYLNDYKTSGA